MSRPGAGGRRIIERPRLIKQLDDATARTILLIAPAGYGKTTLARQWLAANPGGLLTVGLAAGDIVVLARSLARALSNAVPALTQVVEEAIRAASSSDTQLMSLVRAILAEVQRPLDEWLVIDDYHALKSGSAPETLIETLEASGFFRLIVASRTRPVWATPRRFLYGEVFELTQEELALDETEAAELLPKRANAPSLTEMAHGWPALVALAASSSKGTLPTAASSAALYHFLAEDVFSQTSSQAREALVQVTLLPRFGREQLAKRLGGTAVGEVLRSGLAYETNEGVEIHPLVRSFLDSKIVSCPDLQTSIGDGISFCVSNAYWDEAFDLIQRFRRTQQLETLIASSYLPLVDAGRIATLEAFGTFASGTGGVPRALLDLIDAEIALRDGLLERASTLGRAAGVLLPVGHALKARAFIIAGSAERLDWKLDSALETFALAKTVSTRSRDIGEASWGRCLSAIFLEDERLRDVVNEYSALGDTSGEDRIRLLIARQNLARLSEGLYDLRRDEAVAHALLPTISDPLVRSGWGNSHGYMLVLQGRYAHAKSVLAPVLIDLDRYALGFARPHIEWSMAAAELGLRQFARADFLLRRVEQYVGESGSPYLHLNARALRARLLLTQRRAEEAAEVTGEAFEDVPRNAMYGEYVATHALALAAAGKLDSAVATAARAVTFTQAVETRVLAAAAIAVASQGTPNIEPTARALFDLAAQLRAWDGVVVAIRAVPTLLTDLALSATHRVQLARVLARSNDRALARSCGLGDGHGYRAQGSLSPRESEVIDLLGQGLKTRDIAGALYISEATVKAHVSHILEKLGARTRAEAVARYTETSARAGASTTMESPSPSSSR